MIKKSKDQATIAMIIKNSESAQAQDTEQLHWIFPQPETHPTTEEQLKAEVRAIYAVHTIYQIFWYL